MPALASSLTACSIAIRSNPNRPPVVGFPAFPRVLPFQREKSRTNNLGDAIMQDLGNQITRDTLRAIRDTLPNTSDNQQVYDLSLIHI